MSYRKPRKVLNIHTKKKIIELADTGLSHLSISKIFEVGRSTVTKILLRKNVILRNEILDCDPRKCLKDSTLNDLEGKLYKWCTVGIQIDSTGTTFIKEGITTDDILTKANELMNGLKLTNFAPDTKWITRFCRKYKLKKNNSKKDKVLLVKSNVPEGYGLNDNSNEATSITEQYPQDFSYDIFSSFNNINQNMPYYPDSYLCLSNSSPLSDNFYYTF
ncbi:hypothetical protein K502DRAFT_68380 [Neoconidiobolus thromboides FSU 785]|nr:hypothetical protein K502DRAFT_68380 [Neoconidiobolus thromboides FSU 785]